MRKILLTATFLALPLSAQATPSLNLAPSTSATPPSYTAHEQDFTLRADATQQAEISKHLEKVEARPGRAGDINKGILRALKLDAYSSIALKKPFIMPAQGILTSPFGYRDLDGKEFHAGQDIANAMGTPIYAAADGVVIAKEELHTSAGNYLVILHELDGVMISTRYLHLDRFIANVGDTVKQGDEIAKMGTTGRSTGPHLHFEVRAGKFFSDLPLEPMRFIR